MANRFKKGDAVEVTAAYYGALMKEPGAHRIDHHEGIYTVVEAAGRDGDYLLVSGVNPARAAEGYGEVWINDCRLVVPTAATLAKLLEKA
jgi:hypothetical protein